MLTILNYFYLFYYTTILFRLSLECISIHFCSPIIINSQVALYTKAISTMIIWIRWILNKTISRYTGTSLKYRCSKHVAFNAPSIDEIPSNGPGRKSHKARTVGSQTVQLSPLIRTRTWSSTRHHIFPSQTSSSRSRPNASKSCGLTFEIENYFNRALRHERTRSRERKRSIQHIAYIN